MPKFKLEDLPPKMRQQAEEQMRGGTPKQGVKIDSLEELTPGMILAASAKSLSEAIRRGNKDPKHAKRIRQQSKPLMNNLETEFWCILCNRYGDPFVKPQAVRLKLGNGIWYKPDFFVMNAFQDDFTQPPHRGTICYEVKGPHAFRGGFENLKVAAHLWSEIQFILAWKENSQWKEQIVLP